MLSTELPPHSVFILTVSARACYAGLMLSSLLLPTSTTYCFSSLLWLATMAHSAGTGDSETLQLLRSMHAMMQRREERAAAKDAAKASAQNDASASRTNDTAKPAVDGNERVVGMLSKILGALKVRVEDKKSASSFGEREDGTE